MRGVEDQPDQLIVVNEYEGTVLSLISRLQPVSRYQILKAAKESPTISYNRNKGSLYPLISRLLERGLVKIEPAKGPKDIELLTLTDSGHHALTRWINDTSLRHSFTHDPLLLRMTSLRDVSKEERIRWIAETKNLLREKKAELDRYRKEVDLPYSDFVHGTAVAMLDAKLEWLDRLLLDIVRESDADAIQ